jgi:putative redox protein
MSDYLVVRHLDSDRFAIDARGHTLLVDQPLGAGGTDTAPTPTELFVAGLASCVAFYARRYLARHQIDAAGLTVSVSYEIGGRPTRVHRINIVVTPPVDLPHQRREAFLAVASHCTVHNTLAEPADVEIALAGEVAALI